MIKIICSLGAALLAPALLLGQSYYFKHYQVENGLSNNTVTCSLQDKMGFLWFGTKDGLNRFDGYSFKVFRKNDTDSASVGNNFIHCLFEDKNATLWVGTEQGMYEYESETEEFHLIPATANMYIDKISEDQNGNLWFISFYRLCRYQQKTKKIEIYDPQKFFVAASFCTTADGTVWIGTSDGRLKRYHPESNSFSGFDLFAHTQTIAHKWIESVSPTTNGYIIAGTSDTDIKLIDPYHSSYTDITLPSINQANLYIRTILPADPDQIWLGTESGAFVYNTKNGKCQQLTKDYGNPYSISDNAVSTMCRDREGGIWIGTYFGGINYLPKQTVFTKYFPQNGVNSISGNVMGEIKKDGYGNLWIGTEDAGLNELQPSTGKFTHHIPGPTTGSISFFNLHGLLIDGDELWIGTFQHGLDVMNVRTGKVVRHYEAGASGFSHNFIYCIYKTDSNEILIGSPTGAFTYNRSRDRFTPFEGFPAYWYTTILKDHKGHYWGGTFGNGLQVYDPASGKTYSFTYDEKNPNSISNNRVTSLFEDSKNDIWIATEAGLCKWNEKAQNFVRYGSANGFPSDFILCIQEDRQHKLWISTTKGLVCFQPSSGSVDVYTTANGLISDQFNYGSSFKDDSGRMYFGSVKGLVSFDPDALRKEALIPPVYLTGLQINGRELNTHTTGSPLARSILYTDKITLTHRQSTLSIDFASVTFSAPETIGYAYNMQGLTNKWIKLTGNRRVDFIELPSGNYTFRVKAFINGDTWSKETTLSITILPPWWQSSLAYAIYLTAGLLVVLYLMRAYNRRIEIRNQRKYVLLQMAKEKEILEMELAKEKELLEAKIDFFTNVAHEIKTPLTLIKVPLKKIMKKAGNLPEIENSLKIMDRNTTRLIELTGQLLDFQQTEIDKFHLSLERVEITGLVSEACAGFTNLAEQNNISFSCSFPPTPFFALIDVDAFHKIIYNLFSNAVKYAATKVCVSVYLSPGIPNSFNIQVKNDGYLIPDELKEKIFEPFYRIRATESQTGTGIGLALARSLAHLHNGHLTLESVDRTMNVFVLTIPTNDQQNTNEA